MKLTYRGNTYKMSAPIQPGSDSTDRLHIKLIYRGHTYTTAPCPLMTAGAIEADSSTVTLTYRGNTYDRTLPVLKPDHQPRAINWRYQVPEV